MSAPRFAVGVAGRDCLLAEANRPPPSASGSACGGLGVNRLPCFAWGFAGLRRLPCFAWGYAGLRRLLRNQNG